MAAPVNQRARASGRALGAWKTISVVRFRRILHRGLVLLDLMENTYTSHCFSNILRGCVAKIIQERNHAILRIHTVGFFVTCRINPLHSNAATVGHRGILKTYIN